MNQHPLQNNMNQHPSQNNNMIQHPSQNNNMNQQPSQNNMNHNMSLDEYIRQRNILLPKNKNIRTNPK